MKCSYKHKKHVIGSDDLKVLNDYIAESFERWLSVSGKTEDEFLSYATKVLPFAIHRTDNYGIKYVSLFCDGVPYGHPIMSSPNLGENTHFNENTAFLLMYMAQKLDGVNGGTYFCKIAKEFARTKLLFNYKSIRAIKAIGDNRLFIN